MRDRLEDLLKWTKRYRLRDRPEALIERIASQTMRHKRIAFPVPLYLCGDPDKSFYAESSGTEFTISRESGLFRYHSRLPAIHGILTSKDGGWELAVRVSFKGLRVRTIAYFAVAVFSLIALVLLYHTIFNPSLVTQPPGGPPQWVFLGIAFLCLFIGLSSENARIQQEAEVLITFFEKLVAPYAVAADTMAHDADARDS